VSATRSLFDMADPRTRNSAGRRAMLLLFAAALLTVVACALVFFGPRRLGVDDWAWPRVADPVWDRVTHPLVVFALVGGLVMVTWGRVARARRGEMALIVAVLVGLGFLAQVTVGQQVRAGYHESLFAIALPGSSSYHVEARKVDRLGPYLRDFRSKVLGGRFQVQLSTHPAGPVVLFWGLNQVFAGNDEAAERFTRKCEDWLAAGIRMEESPAASALFERQKLTPAAVAGAWLATVVLRLAACLVVVPVYLMASRWYGRTSGLVAAAFAAAIPSLLLFSPIVDQCYPVLAATACWLADSAGERRSGWRAFLAGLVVSAGLFMTLAFAVVAFWAALLALARLLRSERPQGKEVAKLLACAAAGLLGPVAALYAACGYNSFSVWWACWEGNAQFNRLTARTYWKWVLVNPVDFLAFLGVPVACLFVRRGAGEFLALARRRVAGRDWPTLAVAGLLLLLNAVGANLGEVARLWMFLMPACAVAAAAQVEDCAPYRRVVFVCLFAFQSVQVVLFRAGLNVLNIT